MATTKKSTRLKEPVKVRTKKLADGSESYYLDIYVDGKRSYEFLKQVIRGDQFPANHLQSLY